MRFSRYKKFRVYATDTIYTFINTVDPKQQHKYILSTYPDTDFVENFHFGHKP